MPHFYSPQHLNTSTSYNTHHLNTSTSYNTHHLNTSTSLEKATKEMPISQTMKSD
ncbi:MAG: hypothetical protein SPD86_07550 [Prevotella sp.]|nr:hypothetical protein [Prevotella sp.]